jgi:hypothetical protein
VLLTKKGRNKEDSHNEREKERQKKRKEKKRKRNAFLLKTKMLHEANSLDSFNFV